MCTKSRRRGSDVGAHVAAARGLTKEAAFDECREKSSARIGIDLPQALRLLFGEGQAGHLKIFTSHTLNDVLGRHSHMSIIQRWASNVGTVAYSLSELRQICSYDSIAFAGRGFEPRTVANGYQSPLLCNQAAAFKRSESDRNRRTTHSQ